MKIKTRVLESLSAALLSVVLTSQLHAQPTSFTYQGQFTDGGSGANGLYDLRFELFDAETNGVSLGPVTNSAVAVSNGLFTVLLDFGTGVFDGDERWLEMGARTNGAGAFTTLTPRQQITSTPYAIQAGNAMTVSTGTISDPSFIGTTTTNMPLELFVNNQRVLRFEDNGDSADFDAEPDGAPNVIAGSPDNFVGPGVVGATIAGGGATNFFQFPNSGPRPNTVLSDYGTIGGGLDNHIESGASSSTISGGIINHIWDGSPFSSIGGGVGNQIFSNAFGTTIAGGGDNEIGNGSTQSTIGGGADNEIGNNSGGGTIAGGASNDIATNATHNTIGGGLFNKISEQTSYAVIPGGQFNFVGTDADHAFAAGQRAHANHQGAFVWADSQPSVFASTANDQFLIRAAGFVGINTPDPSSDLTISSSDSTITGLDLYNTTIPAGSGGWRHQVVGNGVAGRVGNFEIWYIGSGVNGLTIQPDGDVGIGTTSPTFDLLVNGSAGKPGGGSWSSASDARLKDVGQPFTRGLEALEGIEPRHYRYAKDNALDLPSDREYVGLIAQDVEAAIPEAIEPNDTGYLHVNNDPILWTMLNGIKELKARSQRSEVRIQSLQAENAELRQELQELKVIVTTLTRKGISQ